MGRVAATLALGALTLAELAAATAGLAGAFPDARVEIAGGDLVVTLPDRGTATPPDVSGTMSKTSPQQVPDSPDPLRTYWRVTRAKARAAAGSDVRDTVRDNPPHTPPVVTRKGDDDRDLSTQRKQRRRTKPKPEPSERLAGMDGPMTETPTPAGPDDLLRRRLAAATGELLARHRLTEARSKDPAAVRSEQAWLATVARRCATAPSTLTAVEDALARWGPDASPAHVAQLLTAPPPPPPPAVDELAAARDVARTWSRILDATPDTVRRDIAARYPHLDTDQLDTVIAATYPQSVAA